MRMSRRELVCVSSRAIASTVALAVAAPALAAPALVGLKTLNVRTLAFDCVNLGEHLNPVDYWVDGKYVPQALAEIDKALRDFVSDEVFPIEPKLLDVLHHLGRTLETDCRFELISGYRSPKTNALLRQRDPAVAERSLHMRGIAADVALASRPLGKLHEAALAMRIGGVGYYPDSNFIHVDIGRVRRWTE
jgi:uncharacterized protein YcbK (DUF882 family)